MIATTTPRIAWLHQHDVVTWRVDMGIGVTWYADHISGVNTCADTEYEACVKLAREIGVTMWDAL